MIVVHMTEPWFLPMAFILGGALLAVISVVLHVITSPPRERFWIFSLVLGILLTFFGFGYGMLAVVALLEYA